MLDDLLVDEIKQKNNNGFNFDQFNSDEYYDGFNHL